MAKIPPGMKDIMVNGKLVARMESSGDTLIDLPVFHAKLQELGYLNEKLPRWMHIRQQAIYFQDTCALLLRTELQRLPPHRPFALIPYVVNTAFCIELYLKALALKHGKQLRGHKLLELYKQLPYSANQDIQASIKDALETAPLDGAPDIASFMGHLNSAFVDWRYAYESEELGQVRMDVMHFLRMVMFFACRNDVPHVHE